MPLVSVNRILYFEEVAVKVRDCCLQGKSEERNRTELRDGVAPPTEFHGQNVSDVLAKSASEKAGSAANNRDELMKQIKELNRALALSEEAVSTHHHHHHHYYYYY